MIYNCFHEIFHFTARMTPEVKFSKAVAALVHRVQTTREVLLLQWAL